MTPKQRRYSKTKDHILAQNAKWKQSNPDWMRGYRLQYALRLKREVFSHYGGVWCGQCNETSLLKLSLDHINDDGAKFRKVHGVSGTKFYAWLRKRNFPDLGLRVLCHNCNELKKFSRPRSAVWMRKYQNRDAFKLMCLSHYCPGPVQCQHCTIQDPRVLTLDHTANDGASFRRKHRIKGGDDFYRYLKRRGFPDLGLQVLCFSCNQAKMIMNQ